MTVEKAIARSIATRIANCYARNPKDFVKDAAIIVKDGLETASDELKEQIAFDLAANRLLNGIIDKMTKDRDTLVRALKRISSLKAVVDKKPISTYRSGYDSGLLHAAKIADSALASLERKKGANK